MGAAHRTPRRSPTGGVFQRAWSGMRTFPGAWTISDLEILATDGSKGELAELYRYVGLLRRAGYIGRLALTRPGLSPFSRGSHLYRLTRNTGPLAPIRRRNSPAIYDHNIGEEVPCRPVSP